MHSRWILLLIFALRPLPSGVHAQDDGAVPLPPYIVEEATKGPPWRYGQLPGFEFLARCPDPVVRGLAEAHFRLHALLGLILPERLQLTFAAPKVVIYYDEELQGTASKEVMATMVQEQEKKQPRPTFNMEMPVGRGGRGLPPQFGAPPRFNFIPNLRLNDKDAMTLFAIVREGSFNSDQLVLTRDYLSYLVFERSPTLPGWFAAGVIGLYNGMEFQSSSLRFAPVAWVSEPEIEAMTQTPPAASPLQPLAQFLTSGMPSRSVPNAEDARERWRVQAMLFLRWALDGRTPAQHAAFFDLVEQASVEPVKEEQFKRGLGVDFATADAQLAAYLLVGAKKSMVLRTERAIKVPKLALRDADDTEISRLKGDWERLEVAFVKKRSPELAPKYLEQARRTLTRAYDNGSRDPGLLANLGLCECDAGNDAKAREYLEAAARRGPLRARANYELARLRFAEFDRNPEGADGRLSTGQMAQVLAPLFAARALPPPMAEVYELIAKAWSRSALGPTRGHLAVVDEGVRLFPRRVPLVYQLAVLHAQRGDTEDARNLVTLGLHLAAEETDRRRFTQLQAELADPAKKAAN